MKLVKPVVLVLVVVGFAFGVLSTACADPNSSQGTIDSIIKSTLPGGR